MRTPVRYSKSLHTSIDGQHISNMSVVEPKLGGVHKDCPVIGVSTLEKILRNLHILCL